MQCAQGDTKRKSTVPSADPIKHPRSADLHPYHSRDECCQRDAPGWNTEGRWIDSKTYKAADNAAAFKPADSSNSGSKYDRGDNSDKCKSIRFSDKDKKQYRDNREDIADGSGGLFF